MEQILTSSIPQKARAASWGVSIWLTGRHAHGVVNVVNRPLVDLANGVRNKPERAAGSPMWGLPSTGLGLSALIQGHLQTSEDSLERRE